MKKFAKRLVKFVVRLCVLLLVIVGIWTVKNAVQMRSMEKSITLAEGNSNAKRLAMGPGETTNLYMDHLMGTSSDERVAYIQDGLVHANNEGVCYIAVKNNDPMINMLGQNRTISYRVEVSEDYIVDWDAYDEWLQKGAYEPDYKSADESDLTKVRIVKAGESSPAETEDDADQTYIPVEVRTSDNVSEPEPDDEIIEETESYYDSKLEEHRAKMDSYESAFDAMMEYNLRQIERRIQR